MQHVLWGATHQGLDICPYPFITDEEVIKPEELYDYVSFLDRGPAPLYGSGPVFIAKVRKDPKKNTIFVPGWGDTAIAHYFSFGAIYSFNWDQNSQGRAIFTTVMVSGTPRICYVAVQLSPQTGSVVQSLIAYTDLSVPELTTQLRDAKYEKAFTRSGGSPQVPYDLQGNPEAAINWLIAVAPEYGRSSYNLIVSPVNIAKGHTEYTQDPNAMPMKNGEYGYWLGEANELPSTPGGLHPGLFSGAYYAAQDKLPQLLSNTFQNLMEAGSAILSLANGIDLNDLKNLRRLAGSAWLAYRYEYNTTLSDLEELESAIERFDDLTKFKGNIQSYGMMADDTGHYHCAIIVDPTQVLNRSMMKKLNLRPTLANIWDMIPYSFIVDWFTNIGDILAAIDRWLDAPSFGDVECWYSFTTNYKTDDGTFSCYFRFSGGRPLLPYWTMDWSHSGKVWAWRATDVVSLLP